MPHRTVFKTFIDALITTGPEPGREDDLHLFGQFVGSWHLAWTGFESGIATKSAEGELHVGWILGGRAVGDTWIVPGPAQPGHGVPGDAFHGSTIRFYDRALGAWRSTWINPVNGTVRRFIGRPVDGKIILISDEDEPRLRWRFTDIAPDRFTWRGEYSTDGGATWVLDDEMRATRITDATARP